MCNAFKIRATCDSEKRIKHGRTARSFTSFYHICHHLITHYTRRCRRQNGFIYDVVSSTALVSWTFGRSAVCAILSETGGAKIGFLGLFDRGTEKKTPRVGLYLQQKPRTPQIQYKDYASAIATLQCLCIDL